MKHSFFFSFRDRFLLNHISLFNLPVLCLILLLTHGHALSAQEQKLRVMTVNYPLMYFAERIAGEEAEVRFPAPIKTDPAFWDPGVVGSGEYQEADLIVLNGAKYARWTLRYSLPRMKTVNTSKSFEDRYIYKKEVVTHSHGPEGEHAHEALASMTWLDPILAEEQAKTLAKALVRIRPEKAESFDTNLKALLSDLEQIDKNMRSYLARHETMNFVASHPSYDYLAARYGLNVKSMDWENRRIPVEHEWENLKKLLADHPSKFMIWEQTPLPQVVERLGQMGLRVIVFDPCANKPVSGDYLSIMRENVSHFDIGQ